jgi:hydroxyacylglutathione hydrolase
LEAGAFTTAIPRIATRDLTADAIVLDVRGADEFAARHVRGAKNIAYTRLAARLDEIPAARPLHVHCGSGVRAAMASSFLASKGVDVIHVDGFFTDIPESLLQ